MIVDYIGISDEARRIKAYFKSINRTMTPERVCKLKTKELNIDIELIEMDLPLSTKEYKANYSYMKRQHIVQYNKRLGVYRDSALYHEVGHRVLHWRDAAFVFHIDSDTYGLKTIYEIEATVFSAEMSLDDDKVLACFFNRRLTFFQTARFFGVPDEILYFKCKILQARGHKIDIPITVSGDCMKGKDY